MGTWVGPVIRKLWSAILGSALALGWCDSGWALDWSDLKASLGSRSFASVEELVAALPDELRRNYVLQLASESPQYASPSQPRVILYSADGNLMLAIGGGPAGRSTSPLIEVIEFDPKTRASLPHLIEIKASGVSGAPSPARIWEDPGDLYPAGHPRNCANCHGTPFRPIWDSYKSWPHSYGSGYRDGWFRQEEGLEWEQFQRTNAHRGLYRHLPNADVVGLLEMEANNLELTYMLNGQNEERIFDQIRRNPVVIRYRREILAAMVLGDQDEFASHLSPEIRADFLAGQAQRREAITKATFENSERKLGLFARAIGRPYNPHFLSDFDREHVETMARLQYFMDRAGISMADWSMTRGKGTFSFSDPTLLFGRLRVKFYQELVLPREPDWSHLISVKSQAYRAHETEPTSFTRPRLSLPGERLVAPPFVPEERNLNWRVDVFQAMASGRSPDELLQREFDFLRPKGWRPSAPGCPDRMRWLSEGTPLR